MSRSRYYVAENKSDWDEYVQYLKLAYNVQVKPSTIVTNFSLVIYFHPTEPTKTEGSTELSADKSASLNPKDISFKLVKRFKAMIQKKEENLAHEKSCANDTLAGRRVSLCM